MDDYHLFVGVDIADRTASVAWLDGDGLFKPAFTIGQTPAGRAELCRCLSETGCPPEHTLVVMEATGTYWMQLALHLHRAGFAVSVINPAQAHYFAQASLQRAKTDALDAGVLARLGKLLRPRCWSPPPPIFEPLHQRLAQRDALLKMRLEECNRLHALDHRSTVSEVVRSRSEHLIALFAAQIEAVDEEIVEVVQQDAAWGESYRYLRTIPGVGPVTAAWLITATLNFTISHTARQLVSYAGLAPRIRESGTSVRGRAALGQIGHQRLREALYMASISAIRHNPVLRAFYRRLKEKGKPGKVAICAVARKLLIIAYAVVTRRQDFDPGYAQRHVALGEE